MATISPVRFICVLTVCTLIGGSAVKAIEPPAGSQECSQQLNALSNEWNTIGLPANSKPAQSLSTGRGRHSHTGGEINFMRNQISQAARLCKNGKEHEAMLRMDAVRSIMKFAEIQHPAEHNYTPVRR